MTRAMVEAGADTGHLARSAPGSNAIVGRFPWPTEGAEVIDHPPPGALPRGGPLGEFAAGAKILSSPTAPGRPWVLATEACVVKAYDLRGFDQIDRRQALVEADTARALSGIDGVVVTYRGEELGDWLVIEMERLGETLAERLDAIEAGRAEPLAPARWGALFEGVAEALAALHRRGVVHRDIKPANLMFERGGVRLLVADFSISSRLARREREAAADDVAGTRRFIAPEIFHGRVGFAVDQYGLAVTARDALGRTAPPAAVEVLRQATAQSPRDRFPGIADFGIALRAALDRDSPYQFSSRLQRVSPKWRVTWGLGGLVLVGTYAFEIAARLPGLGPSQAIGGPLLFAGAAMVISRALNRLRGKRTRPRVAVADRAWFAPLIFGLVAFASRELAKADPTKAKKLLLGEALGAIAIAAWLGSTPPDAGGRLIRFVRRQEHRHAEAVPGPARRWTVRLAGLVGLILLGVIPVAVSKQWPDDTSPTTARAYPQLVAVARSRAALLSADPRSACRLIRVPAAPEMVPCRQWAPVAGRWLRTDLKTRHGIRFEPAELGDVYVSSEGSDQAGVPTWGMWLEGSPRLVPGALGPIEGAPSAWEVLVGRETPQSDPQAFTGALWNYELVERSGAWLIVGEEICNFDAHEPCLHISQIRRDEWSEVINRRPT
jgi:tRNA A-37 threonylcarbamoyl transferase component Bud32